jgi:hypothetical protein
MKKIKISNWNINKANVFNERVHLMHVILEHTKLGLKGSKDICDNLIEGKEEIIEVVNEETLDAFSAKLTEKGVIFTIE